MVARTTSELISAVFQVLLFTLIPFIIWLITARKKESFFSWIGFKKIGSDKKNCFKFIVLAFVICEVIGQILNNTILKAEWNVSPFAGMGAQGIPCALIYSYIHTALSEEILYRGFLQKRLQSIFSFKVATLIQAFLFGLTHVVLSFNQITFIQGVGLLLYPMVPGILIAYVNEKKADGSILPGCLIHGTLNAITHLIQL